MVQASIIEKLLKELKNTFKKKEVASNHLHIGKKGEEYALKYLLNKAYKLEARNWTCKIGEIDLIFKDKQSLVFVEVKTRKASAFSHKNIFNNISRKKQEKLKKLSQIYIFKHYYQKKRPHYRIDAIGVILDNSLDQVSKIYHIKGAVRDYN